MGKNTSEDDVQHPVKGIAADILKEVIKADMSMHAAQIEAWQWFANNRPKGEFINDDLHEGFARNMYLALSELKLQLNIKPVRLSIWKRIALAFKVLFRGTLTAGPAPVVFEICSNNEVGAMRFEITVTRNKNGTVKAAYRPADDLTAELLKTSSHGS
jgi:hypothetical protein